MTLTLKFDLIFKNFIMGRSLFSRSVRTFILHICVHCDKIFYAVSSFFDPVTLTLEYDLIFRRQNTGYETNVCCCNLHMVATGELCCHSDKSGFFFQDVKNCSPEN